MSPPPTRNISTSRRCRKRRSIVSDVLREQARASGKPDTVVLALVKLKDGWRIHDITWQRDGKAETLRGMYAHGMSPR